jgi:hypothetical protein
VRPTSDATRGARVRKGTFIDHRAAEPAVLVRLVLLAADEGTREERVVGSFLKRIPMPSDLAPGMTLALDLFGERHIFHPTDIVWDEAGQICIVEVVWMVSEAARSLATVKAHAVSGHQGGFTP